MKLKYRLRYFSSKEAFVVMWNLLISTVSFSSLYFFSINFPIDPTVALQSDWLSSIPRIVSILCAPLSGWLADAKFGNYHVFRVGTIILFSGGSRTEQQIAREARGKIDHAQFHL